MLLTGDESPSCLHSSRPVGFARLTFVDERYYEFMCFDEPKVVWSPECDHEMTRSLEMVENKDRYIGSLCLDIGMVPSEFGQLPEYRGVIGTPRGV